MAVSIMNPGRQPDPLERIANAVNIAQSIYGIHKDSKLIDQAIADKAQQKELTSLQLKEAKRKEASEVSLDVPNTPLVEAARKQAQLKGISLPEQMTERQLKGMGVLDDFYKPKEPKAVDPFAQELKMQRIADGKRKQEEDAQKKTPKGRLAGLNSGDKQRFDNVVLGINAITGMEKALPDNNTFSLVGDNDFTRNGQKWEEAIGRMQSGGAISDSEAKRFRTMVPTFRDTKDQQTKKLADMRAVMEQRFNTFGFDKGQAGELGLDSASLGWNTASESQAPAGITLGGKPVNADQVQAAAAAILQKRRSQVSNSK